MLGGDGNDTIIGGDGSDTISGGAGNDYLRGNGGNDYFTAGGGHDTVLGGSGRDVLDLTGHNYEDAHVETHHGVTTISFGDGTTVTTESVETVIFDDHVLRL